MKIEPVTPDNTAILLTSHPGHQWWMDAAFTAWRGCPYYILVGYDDVDVSYLPVNRWQPPVNEWLVTGFPAKALGHIEGDLYQMRIGAQRIAEHGRFRYIIKSAVDDVLWVWRRIQHLAEWRGLNDILNLRLEFIFTEVEKFIHIMDLYHIGMRLRTAESYWGNRVLQLGYTSTRRTPFWMSSVLGRIHLQGQWAKNNNMEIKDSWSRGVLWQRKEKGEASNELKKATIQLEREKQRDVMEWREFVQAQLIRENEKSYIQQQRKKENLDMAIQIEELRKIIPNVFQQFRQHRGK